ncbi:elongase of fatty acids ELO [Meredithblackwellia eburnea MCA 4105]
MSFHGLLSSLPLPALPQTLAKWTPAHSPLSTNTEVVAALALYLAVIFGGRWIMTDRKPFQFKPLFMLHNFLLSAGSLIVLVLMVEDVLPILWNNGFFFAICSHQAWTPRLETLYIINYYFKYWELFDTVFLVLKKKPLQFLHVFHHTATAALCFTQLNGRTSVSWVPIVANLTVHVFMYYYYLVTAAGGKVWWKKYLTTMQITQFVVDLFVVYFATYSYFVAEYFPGVLPSMGTCAGTEGAAVFGCALLTSYLFLFIAFYKKTYNSAAAKKAALASKGPSKSVAEFKKKN